VTAIRRVIKSIWFTIGVDLLIITYAIYIGIEIQGISSTKVEIVRGTYLQTLSVWELAFFCAFTLEILLRLFALGFVKYFRSWLNKFDCLLMIASFGSTFILPLIFEGLDHRAQIFRILLLLRVVRLSRWFTKLERFKILIATMTQIAPTLLTFIGILIVAFYWFAVLGMTVWAGRISPNNSLLVDSKFAHRNWFHLSFNNFFESLALLFACTSIKDWPVIADAFELISSSAWAWLYFCFFVLYISIILMGVLASVTLDAFVVQFKVKQMKTKSPVQERIEQLRISYTIGDNKDKDTEGIFIDKKRKRKWTVKSKPDMFQLYKAIVKGEVK